MNKYKKTIKTLFEQFLWRSRFMVFSAVIASLILSLILFFITLVDVVSLLGHTFEYFHSDELTRKELQTLLVGHTVSAVDEFLLATVLLIFALGLYELFISDIDDSKTSKQASKVLIIKDLEDLKSKLTKVILIILVVTFFEIALSMPIDSPLDLVYFALGILMVALALYFTSKSSR